MTDAQTIEHFATYWNMKITSDGNGYIANGLAVRPETATETRKSIGRDITSEVTVWVIEGEDVTLGGRMEPDTVDVVELARENNLALAFAKIKQLELDWAITTGLEAAFDAMAEADFDEYVAKVEADLV